jgi:hypothetical protein
MRVGIRRRGSCVRAAPDDTPDTPPATGMRDFDSTGRDGWVLQAASAAIMQIAAKIAARTMGRAVLLD